ncbi:MAG TPA: FHA domain-containing protein [Chloroflexota bacterium]
MPVSLSRVVFVSLWAMLAWLLSSVVVHAQQAPAPLEMYLTNFYFDEAFSKYRVLVSITDPTQVRAIEPRLLDLSTGENVLFGPKAIDVTLSPVAFDLPVDQLKATRKYKLALRAVDRRSPNQYIRRQSQFGSEDPLTFASQEFTYTPSLAAQVTFQVDGVNADFVARQLAIAVHHTPNDRLRYEAVITSKGGAKLGQLGPATLDKDASTVRGPLPQQMLEIDQPAEYHLIFRLYFEGKLLGTEGKDFTLPAPPSPNFVQRLADALVTHPWLGWGTAGVVLLVVLSLAARQFIRRRPRVLPRPYNVDPVVLSPKQNGHVQAGPPAAELVVRVAGVADEYYSLQAAETTIGRSADNAVVLADQLASPHHARVVRTGRDYVLEPYPAAEQPVLLNGFEVVQPEKLSNGDQIEVGQTVLVFAR